MDIEVVKKLIKKHMAGHSDFVRNADEAERYYKNETDVLRTPSRKEKQEKENEGKRPCAMRITGFPLIFMAC